jgi:hypothetical protein
MYDEGGAVGPEAVGISDDAAPQIPLISSAVKWSTDRVMDALVSHSNHGMAFPIGFILMFESTDGGIVASVAQTGAPLSEI